MAKLSFKIVIYILLVLLIVFSAALLLYKFFKSKQATSYLSDNKYFVTDGTDPLQTPVLDDPILVFRHQEENGAKVYQRGPETYYLVPDSNQLILLSIQGKISDLNYKQKYFYIEGGGSRVKLDFSIKEVPIYFVDYLPPEGYSGHGFYVPRTVLSPASFDDITVGDVVTYNVPNVFSQVERVLLDKK